MQNTYKYLYSMSDNMTSEEYVKHFLIAHKSGIVIFQSLKV